MALQRDVRASQRADQRLPLLPLPMTWLSFSVLHFAPLALRFPPQSLSCVWHQPSKGVSVKNEEEWAGFGTLLVMEPSVGMLMVHQILHILPAAWGGSWQEEVSGVHTKPSFS